METQNFLYENSSKMPEGLYIELMNKLKIDFETKEPETKIKIIVINKKLPKMILCSKEKLLKDIIKYTINFENREEILLNIIGKPYQTIRNICNIYEIPLMCLNPRWVAQEEVFQSLPSNLQLSRHRGIGIYDLF